MTEINFKAILDEAAKSYAPHLKYKIAEEKIEDELQKHRYAMSELRKELTELISERNEKTDYNINMHLDKIPNEISDYIEQEAIAILEREVSND